METRSHFRLATAVRWYRRYRGYRRYQGYQRYRYNSFAIITHRPATSLTLPLVLPVPSVPPVTPVPPLVGGSTGMRGLLAWTSLLVLPVSAVPPVPLLSGRSGPWG
jgi:hypothetical protein